MNQKRHQMTIDLKGLRCARYLRCSTDDQAQGDYSTIDAQDTITLRYVAENGGKDAGRYVDDGRTGTNLKRPGWKRLLTDAESRKFDAVIFTYMSRLGRGDTFIVARYELEKHGVRVLPTEEPYSDDTAGYVQRSVKNFIDGMYPLQVREWTLTKLEQMFQQGFYVGGGVIIGYDVVPVSVAIAHDEKTPKRLAVDESERPIVSGAFEAALVARSVREAANYLTRATGEDWTYQKAYRFLSNRLYAGEVRWRHLYRQDECLRIVEQGVFDAVQEVIEAAKEGRARRVMEADRDSQDPDVFYLRGLIHCAHCGYAMTPKPGTSKTGVRVPYYECVRACKHGAGKCSIGRVNAWFLHEAIFTEVALMAAHPWRIRRHIEAALERMPKPETREAELSEARKRLRAIENRIEKLVDAIAEGGRAIAATLSRRIETEEGRREVVAGEVRRLAAETAAIKSWRPNARMFHETLTAFSQIWENRSDSERCRLSRLLIDRVEAKEKGLVEVTLLPALAGDLSIPADLLWSTRGEVRKQFTLRDGPATDYEHLPESFPTPLSSKLPIEIRVNRGKRSREEVGTR